jgi:predicted RNase H-like HicB family nuclease
MPLAIEIDQEDDGRWLAEIPELPAVMAYGVTPTEAIARIQALGLRVLADRVELGEAVPTGVDRLLVVPTRADGSRRRGWAL